MRPILYLCTEFPRTSETFILDQVRAFAQAGYEVTVLSISAGDATASAAWHSDPQPKARLHIMYDRIRSIRVLSCVPRGFLLAATHPRSWSLVFHCLFHAPAQMANALLCSHWLRKHPHQDSGVLICHFGPVGYIGALLRAWGLLKMPQLTVFHGFDMSSLIRRKGEGFYRELFDSPGHASVAITKHWRRALDRMGDRNASWLPLGVNTQAFTFRPRHFPVDRPVRFITVGRLVEKKGQDDVIQALARLPLTCRDMHWEYHLVGAGPEEARLRQLVRALELQDKVVFHGAQSHRRTGELLDASDVFILASRTGRDGDMEGLPVALMEALAAGMPTISTQHSGIPELIEHGRSGLLGPEGDLSALTENIATLLQNHNLWAPLAIAGRQQVEANYDISKNFRRFAEFSSNFYTGVEG